MRIQPKIALISVLSALSLAACGQNDGDDSASAQSKFSVVTASGDRCVLDSDTGLLWAGKTDAPGLHDFRNTYSWYDPNEAHGELDYRGTEDGGECTGSSCDTWHLVLAVNEAGYCGHTDWRLPTKDELFSISDLLRASNPPTIDTDFFPHAHSAEYWSGNDYSFQWDAAWAWNFQFGHDRVDWKKTPKYVRLVRGSGENLPEVKE
ncbi:MAG: DUF1566 domain-containing protein [Gammaproteobacteria bacterium]|nr:DUF1566 domain-containing protein [Gammaproteobacteria bacterium]